MNNLKISVLTLFFLLLLLYLHIRGMTDHLYMTYWFYDIILHFLGGASVGLSVFCISKLLNINIIKNHLTILIFITLLAGVAWEVFEVYYGIAGHVFGTPEYNIDTTKDLIMDTFGGTLIFFLYKNK